jgi:hypothetical protein
MLSLHPLVPIVAAHYFLRTVSSTNSSLLNQIDTPSALHRLTGTLRHTHSSLDGFVVTTLGVADLILRTMRKKTYLP